MTGSPSHLNVSRRGFVSMVASLPLVAAKQIGGDIDPVGAHHSIPAGSINQSYKISEETLERSIKSGRELLRAMRNFAAAEQSQCEPGDVA